MKRKKKAPRSARKLWPTLTVLASLGAALYFIFLHTPSKFVPPRTTGLSQSRHAPASPSPKLQPGKFSEPIKAIPEIKPTPKSDQRPLVAIVIDDMGYRKSTGDKILALNLNLSFAFLPFAPHTAEQAAIAHRLGRDILLHLPMEPTDRKWKPGPGTLLLAMNLSQSKDTFLKDLAAVPMAIGVNNHMGSRYTEDRAAMKNFLQQLRRKNLFFLDSLTSSNSVGYSLAKELGVDAIRRNVFLDNEQHKDKIISQLEKLVRIAEKQGFAVGIAHPHKETLRALTEYQGRLTQRVHLVGIHSLVKMNE